MSQKVFDRYEVIDADTHITEPLGVWADRVATKRGNKAPHIRDDFVVDGSSADPNRLLPVIALRLALMTGSS